MATETRPIAIIPVDAQRPPHAKRPSQKRAASKRPTTIYRMALPLVYAGMGVALGTLTGLSVAFITVPVDASIVASDSTQAVQASDAQTSTLAATQPVENTQPAQVVRVAENIKSAGENENTPAAATPTSAPEVSKGAKEAHSTDGKASLSKAPAAEKTLNLPAVPTEALPRKQVAHPVIIQPRKMLASEPQVLPISIDNEQLAMADDTPAPTSTFYSEGDLTVADYNAAAGTIQTSDGRTFVLGTTVRASSATSWDDYRSTVHYRCDQEGSCTLMRAGAVAPNAKMI
jgi:hypothetical protein